MRAILRATLVALCLTAGLAGCDTAEQRAEQHFARGLEYLQSGDVDRALVEFRNVFKLNGEHREARIAYARAERARGNLREAYSQYLRLVEQYPEDVEGLKALAELSAEAGQWQDADAFLDRGMALLPDDPGLKAVRIFTNYGDAVQRNDVEVIVASVEAARALLVSRADDLWLRKVIIDDLIRAQRLDMALAELDSAIAVAPGEKLLYAQRLSVNAALGDNSAVEAGLIEMVSLFPDAPEMAEALKRWYLSRREFDKAEAFLRSRIDPESPDNAPLIDLVRFLGEFRGAEAALKELDAIIESGRSVPVFRSARAGFRFDQGDRDGAIAELEDLARQAAETDDGRTVKVALARMKLAVGDSEAAHALVEQVLDEDSGNVEAIKLKADRLINEDLPGEAVSLLRDAIDQNPLDPALLTLLARAHDREGNKDLMREMLARAVEVSGRAPAESLRYAQVLASEGRLVAAEGILVEALKMTPGDRSLLVPLGQVYVQLKDWPRAETVAAELERLGAPELAGEIASLRSAVIGAQQSASDALAYLERLAAQDGAGLGARLAVLQNHLANGRGSEALAYAAALLAQDPENPDLVFIDASVKATVGETEAAEAGLRHAIDLTPDRPAVWLTLFGLVQSDKSRSDEAAKVLEQALAANPGSGELLWAKAGLLEAKGDIDGAIAIYEDLYRKNSANPIVANNLASLLSTHRQDPESLSRAEVVSRRLKGSTVPAYQDTVGWIAHLTGDSQTAIAELERAAEGLPGDPVVRYHLAMAHLAAGRSQDAANGLSQSLALAGADDSRPFVISARTELDRLIAAGFAPESP
jgi:tetratricopeptide (TPR) repeat protein